MATSDRIYAALIAGDIPALLEAQRDRFGIARMEEGSAEGSGQQQSSGGKPFTGPSSQAELDAIVNQAVARTHSKYADYDAIKDKASKWEQSQAASQSEVEKLTSERDAAAKERDAAAERANRIARDAAIVTEAAKLQAKNPQHIAALIPTDQVTVGKDGNVTGAADAVKNFAAENKEYFGATSTTTGPPAHGLGSRNQGDIQPGQQGRAEAERRFGKK